ncbi:MAG TPA: flagellar hook-basal body complex protein FliE [Deltaproteobacteria bacterium]|nr:flagellar hook-basal body complex protein FliE [Deltaproteobacteria bacterium]
MVDSIKGILSGQQGAAAPRAADGGREAESFSKLLKESINKVNELQNEAGKAMEKLAKGEDQSIHATMIAAEKANVSFNMMVQVRNKILKAYEEIMRMQV